MGELEAAAQALPAEAWTEGDFCHEPIEAYKDGDQAEPSVPCMQE